MIESMVYMSGVIILMIIFAIRTENGDVKPAVLLAVSWPLSIWVILACVIIWSINWDLDIVKGAKWFGYRKPNNPLIIKGFAITILKLEFQFWKKKQK